MADIQVNRLSASISNAPGLSGNFTVLAALSKSRRFGAGQDGQTFSILAIENTAWEVRTGCQYTHATATLTRGSLEDSSSGSAVAFTSGCVVTVTNTAAWANALQNTRSLFNFAPKNYPKTRKAISQLISDGISFGVPCIGDSTTEGYDGTLAGCVLRSWIRRTADRLTSKGLKTGWQNIFGDHSTFGQGTTLQVVDTRVTAPPSGWSLASGAGVISGPGGEYFINNSNTNPFTFTPTAQTDTLDLFYFDLSGYDTITIKSGAAGETAAFTGGTVVPGSSNRIKKATATFPLGSNVWTVQKANTSGAALILGGLSAYNSTQPEMSLYNFGCGGKATAYFNGSTQFWDTLPPLTQSGSGLLCPLIVVMLGINDWAAGATQASMFASLSAIVAAYKAGGAEVLLVVPVPSVVSIASLAAQNAIAQAIYSVAYATNSAVIDLTARWINGASALANGYFGDSLLHPSAFGYVDVGSAMSDFFLSL